MERRVVGGLTLLALVLAAAAAVALMTSRHPGSVTISQLVSDPQRYKDREVDLFGFLVFQFEESSIFTSRTHAEFMDFAHRVALADQKDHSDLHGQFIRIRATFRTLPTHPDGFLDSTTQIAKAKRARTFPNLEAE